MKALFLLSALFLASACAASSSQDITQKAQRKLLQRSPVKLQSPTVYEKRENLTKNGKIVTYDPRPQFVAVDEKAGKYELRWIGYDGKLKIIAYQRRDVIDLVVSSETVKTGDGQYEYTYDLYNLPSSVNYLQQFIVQTFADITPDISLRELDKQDKLHMGEMSPDIYRFREGYWRGFASIAEATRVQPGQHFIIKFTSSAPPGLVGCAASAGEATLKGVGEHMPSELENALPGYDVYPSGQTIGPVDSLGKMTRAERGRYLLERLAQFQEAGWLTDFIRQEYAKLLQAGGYDALLARLDKDLQQEQITSEVYSLAQLLK
jgi:hypothetical protein